MQIKQNKTDRDNLKKALPSITVSGTFKNGHSTNNLIKHSEEKSAAGEI